MAYDRDVWKKLNFEKIKKYNIYLKSNVHRGTSSVDYILICIYNN